MTPNDDKDKIDIAKAMPELWELLSEPQRRELAANLRIRVFEKNDIIYSENDTPQYFMCLLTGKVKVYKDGCGRNQIIRMINQSEYFAYRAAFAGEDYQTSASAFERCTVCMIPIELIKRLMNKNNRLAVFFIVSLSKMLGTADLLTVSLTQKHIRGRLAESLINLKTKYGVEEDGSTLSIYLSREDLANMSNMTTSNAIRTLSAFAAEKLIAIDGRKIRLIEEHALRNISKMG